MFVLVADNALIVRIDIKVHSDTLIDSLNVIDLDLGSMSSNWPRSSNDRVRSLRAPRNTSRPTRAVGPSILI